jgi:hypothetical protein
VSFFQRIEVWNFPRRKQQHFLVILFNVHLLSLSSVIINCSTENIFINFTDNFIIYLAVIVINIWKWFNFEFVVFNKPNKDRENSDFHVYIGNETAWLNSFSYQSLNHESSSQLHIKWSQISVSLNNIYKS